MEMIPSDPVSRTVPWQRLAKENMLLVKNCSLLRGLSIPATMRIRSLTSMAPCPHRGGAGTPMAYGLDHRKLRKSSM
eukprot:scaffold30163_cov124-Isochrysis_galbana.AAC.3